MILSFIVFFPLLFSSLFLFKKNKILINPLFFSIVGFTVSIGLLNEDLMNIYPISSYTWAYIYFCLTLILIGGYFGVKSNSRNIKKAYLDFYPKKKFIFFTILSVITIIVNSYDFLKNNNGFSGFLLNYNKLYGERIDGDISVLIPYMGSLIYISASYGGLILGKKLSNNYFKYGLIPVFFVLLDSFLNFGRANLLIGILSFLLTFSFSRYRLADFKFKFRLSSTIKISFFTSVILFVMVFIRDIRGGLENYKFKNSNFIIENLQSVGLFQPSLYIYMSSPSSVLHQTFNSKIMTKKDIPLENTFAPISRLYDGFFIGETKKYEDNLFIGERYSNVGTMFKDFLLDFGILGSFVFCFVLGLFWGSFQISYINGRNIVIYCLFGTYLIMGVWANLFRSGQFLFPFLLLLGINFLSKFRWKQN